MQTKPRPLILLFILAVFLCVVKGISLISHFHEDGIRAFSMMTLPNYLSWLALLTFIHLYIHSNFYAWHVAFVAILIVASIFLQFVLFAETPSNPHMSEWHYRFFGLGFIFLSVLYMLLRYKAYKVYTERGNLGISDDLLASEEKGTTNLHTVSQNPLKEAFVVAVLVFVFNGFSLMSRFYEHGISTALSNMSILSVFLWLLNLGFITAYTMKKYIALHIATICTITILCFASTRHFTIKTNLAEWQMKLFVLILCVSAFIYLYIKWKPYKSFTAESDKN